MTPDEMTDVAMVRGAALRRRRLAVRSAFGVAVLAAAAIPSALLLGPSGPARQTFSPAPVPTPAPPTASASASPSPTASASASASPTPTATCADGALTAAWGDVDGAGGSDERQVLLTNTADSPCVLQGTAAVAVTGAAGQQASRAAVPGERLGTGTWRAAPASPVVLPARGGRAATWLSYSGGSPDCQVPVTVTITAPGTSRPLVLPAGVTVCDPVVEAVTTATYRPGDAASSSTPPSTTAAARTPLAPAEPGPTGTPPCRPSDLDGAWAADRGAGAGMVTSRIVLTSTAQRTCTLQGVPHVEYLGDDGRRLVSQASDAVDAPAVVLPPGGTTEVALSGRGSDDFGGGCAGRPGEFEVTLPGESVPVVAHVGDGVDVCGPLTNSYLGP